MTFFLLVRSTEVLWWWWHWWKKNERELSENRLYTENESAWTEWKKKDLHFKDQSSRFSTIFQPFFGHNDETDDSSVMSDLRVWKTNASHEREDCTQLVKLLEAVSLEDNQLSAAGDQALNTDHLLVSTNFQCVHVKSRTHTEHSYGSGRCCTVCSSCLLAEH